MDSHTNINKRKALRKSIKIPVEYRSREDKSKGTSIDLSETGISIITDNYLDVGEVLDVGLVLDKEQFYSEAVVRHFKDGPEKRAWGLQFLGLSEKNRNNIRHVLNFPFDNNLIDYTSYPYSLNLNQSNHKIIADKKFISFLVNKQFLDKQPLYVKPHLSAASLPFSIQSLDFIDAKGRIVIQSFMDDDFNLFLGYKNLVFFMYLQTACYICKTEILYKEGPAICLEIPNNMIQLWRRSHPKSRLDVSGRNACARIFSGRTNKEYIVPVKDIGFRGVSVNLPDKELVSTIDNEPLKINLNIDDDLDLTFSVNLRYTDAQYVEGKKIYTSGFEIFQIAPETKEKMDNFIFEQNYPYIKTYDEKCFNKVWDLFFKSGYMIPDKRDYAEQVKKEIEKTWAKIYRNNSKIGKMFLFKDNGEIYGTLAVTQSYENTWVIHQMAGVKHQQFSMAHYLHEGLILQYIEHLDNAEYVKAYFRNDNKWAKSFHMGFQQFVNDNTRLYYSYLDLYELDIGKYDFIIPPNNKYSINFLSSLEDSNFILNHLIKNLPNIIIKSENFNSEELFLRKTNNLYKNMKLNRNRDILLIKDDNKIISFAILESGSTGINIGGLFDIFQIFTTEHSYYNLDDIQKALIYFVMKYYHSLGKKTALCLSDNTHMNILTALGYRKKFEYIILYINRIYGSQFIHYMNYLYSLYNKKN